jgi:DNA-binding transcriptional regulator YdaS (Cro superfamily)
MATKKTGIEQALEMFGGSPTRLARAVGDPVIRQHVEHWLKAGRVPADKAPSVKRVTGISCDLLCPGVEWAEVAA